MNLIEPLLYAAAGSLVGLAGAWAALGRGHWCVRWLLVMAFVAAPVLFGGWELVVTHGVAVLLIVAGTAASRWREWRKKRFSLASLLLLPAAAAPIAAALTTMPAGLVRWSGVFAQGGMIAVVTLLCLWAHYGSARRSAKISGLACALFLLAIVSARLPHFSMLNADYLLSFYSMMSSFIGGEDDVYLQYINVPVLLEGACVASILSFARRSQTKAAAVIAVLVVAALPGYVFYKLCTPAPLPPIDLPESNGYDDFVAAGEMIAQIAGTVDLTSASDVAGLTEGELAALMERLQPAFDRIDRGIALGSRSPFPYWPVQGDEQGEEMYREHFHALMLCHLAGEQRCKYYAKTGDLPRFLEAGLQQMQYCYEVNRGASLVGSFAVGRLQTIELLRTNLHRFNREQREHLIEEMGAVIVRRESYESLNARQRLIEQRGGWRIHLASLLRGMASEENESPGLFWVRLTDAEVRMLLVQAALQECCNDQGVFPTTLDALVPGYLAEIPENPFGDGSFGYQSDGLAYEIISSANDPRVIHKSTAKPIRPPKSASE